MNSVFHAFCETGDGRRALPLYPGTSGRDYCPEGAEFSYSGIAQRAIALARVYAEAGFGHGHRVALLLENRPEFFDHFLALNSLGVSIVPVNPDYVHNELVYQLDHSDAALVVALSSRVDDMQKRAGERPQTSGARRHPCDDDDAKARSSDSSPGFCRTTNRVCHVVHLWDDGAPKGCILSNYYFLNAGEWYLGMGGRAEMRPNEERVFNPLPLYHMNALAVTGTA